jgi:hypothetical protein
MIAWAGLENLWVNKSVFSPFEIQALGFEPKWKLDPSVRNYFPSTHKRDPIELRSKYSPELIAKAEQTLKEGKFDDAIIREGSRSAINGLDFAKAETLCREALKLSPDDKTIQRMLIKIESRQQTHELVEKNQMITKNIQKLNYFGQR